MAIWPQRPHDREVIIILEKALVTVLAGLLLITDLSPTMASIPERLRKHSSRHVSLRLPLTEHRTIADSVPRQGLLEAVVPGGFLDFHLH